MELFEGVALGDDLKRRLEQDCRSRLPEEACGVLFGRVSATEAVVDGYALIRNAAAQPERAFAFDPNDWVSTVYEANKYRRHIVGFFHSHPDGSAEPSLRDIAGQPGWGIYLILAMKNDGAIFRFYRQGASMPAQMGVKFAERMDLP